MTSEDDETASTNVYELTCTDCAFETTVEGSVFDALDVADSHQDEHGQALTEHFVNFELSERE